MAVSPIARASLLVILLAGCAGPGADGGLPDERERHRGASPVEVVAASAPEAEFTSVHALDVDSRGNIYVPDTYQQRITVLGPDGRVSRRFGRRGSGPDEFRSIQNVQILRGDSLLAYDPMLGRVSIFAPGSGDAAEHVTLGSTLPGAVPWQVRTTPSGGAFVATFRPGFAFGRGPATKPRVDRVAVLKRDGSLRRDLLELPAPSFLVAETSIMPHPFGFQGFIGVGSGDRVYVVRSDTLGVRALDLEGGEQNAFRFAYSRAEISAGDQAQAVSQMPDEIRTRFAPVLADSLPGRWPAVRQMLVDDRDRVWLALGGSPGPQVEWAAFTPAGRYLGSVLVPEGSEVRVIRANGLMYAERLDENDVPQVVVYRMARPIR